MLQAELHGKLSSRSSERDDDARLEDTLTSAVFGALQYLPRATALRAVLAASFNDLSWSQEDCARARFIFWPTFADGTEPDLVLMVGDRLLVIEAKYESGFGERQLEREWDGSHKMAVTHGLSKVLLLAVTKGAHESPTS